MIMALSSLAVAGMASASTIGTIGFIAFGSPTMNTSQIGSATEVAFPALDVVNCCQTGNFTSIGNFSIVTLSTALTSGFTFVPGTTNGTWNQLIEFGPSNDYQFDANQVYVTQTAPANNAPGALNIEFFGTFKDTSNVLQSNTGSLNFAFSQSSNSAPPNYSGTFAVPGNQPPPPGTPEPATFAMIGAALVGLTALRKKRA